MLRTLSFLILTGLAALGAAWIADTGGDVTLAWNGWRVSTSLLLLLLGLLTVLIAAMVVWSILGGLLRAPARLRKARRERQLRRGRHAIAQGLVAIGAGDADAARRFAQQAQRHAGADPLTLLLTAQSAQLAGDRASARRSFETMASRADTRALGLRGLFIEAQRDNDAAAAVAVAEEALRAAPATPWASQALLAHRSTQGDWTGAIAIVERNYGAGAIDRALYRRQRAVLLTAQALALQDDDRDEARACVMQAVKLAPTLIPAAVLAGKFFSEGQQIRKAMQVIETAWREQPHPDLADAYTHVRTGDSALERLRRMEKLAALKPDDAESALGLARAAADAHDYARARAALSPLLEQPTQRVALLMAEIERGEHDDEGAARAWTMRAVHARRDPAWTADGTVSDQWRPVSPTGKLDAFRWIVPVAELFSPHSAALDAELAADLHKASDKRAAMIAHASAAEAAEAEDAAGAATPEAGAAPTPDDDAAAPQPQETAAANASAPPKTEAAPPQAEAAPAKPEPAPATTPAANAIPPVIPMMRAPDDPGPDDDADDPDQGQRGGLRGFMSRIRR